MTVRAPIQAVSRILVETFLIVVGAELIGRAHHDLAMQFLDRQAVVDEELRQVVEQLRMCRPLAGDTEVAWRIDEPGSEVAFPDAIDDDADRDWLPQDRFSGLETPAARRERRRRRIGQDTNAV